MNISIKTPQEIEIMAQGGKILAEILQKVLAKTVPGTTTLELDKYTEQLILAAGAQPSFKIEKGYQFSTCMNVNDMVVHGLPSEYQLQNGDILGVDLGVFYKGFHTDGSWTIEVQSLPAGKAGEKLKVKSKFLETGEIALQKAIEKCVEENHIGDISKTIQDIVERAGYSSVKQLMGHGVGKKLHEDPDIPCFLRGKVENTPKIKIGMVLAVEIIYNEGKSPIWYQNDDGWTIVTRDSSLSGLFEHTVTVTENGPMVLTKL